VDFQERAFSGEECAEIVEELAMTRKASEATEARAAIRAGKCGAYRSRGFGGTHDWLAVVTGTSVHQAKAALETVAVMASLPDTRAALMAGELSLSQAAEIAKTEAKAPGNEAELLELARSAGLGPVRERGRKRRMEAIRPEELAGEQHAARELAHWPGELGMTRGSFALPPKFGVPFVRRLDAETDRVYRRARSQGEHPTRAQCAADAFMCMVQGQGRGNADRADVVYVLDVNAAIRGHAHPGEVSKIIGGSPVAVSVIMQAARDAFIKAVLHDGQEIQHVVHFGRRPNALQRTALMLGIPPEFDGVKCCEPGCDRRYGLQYDHVDPVANGGPTSLRNLRLPCGTHHDEKTERDRRAGLLEGTRRNKGKGKGEGRGPP
jgi:hypothetical protein